MMGLVHQAVFDKRGVIDTGIDCDDLSCLERYIGTFHDLLIHAGVTNIHVMPSLSSLLTTACLLGLTSKPLPPYSRLHLESSSYE